jgi:solute carrier family 25 phosphate transporter 3
MLSAINKGAGPKGGAKVPMYKRLVQVGGELGVSGLWAGLGPRIGKLASRIFRRITCQPGLRLIYTHARSTVMTAGLVTGQFLIYGWIKEALSAPPGVEIHKEVQIKG